MSIPDGRALIGIYRLTREWSTYRWLCDRHVEARTATRWSAERTGDVHGDCGDREVERQNHPSYRTPTLIPAWAP